MLILECSQGCYVRRDGRTDGSVTISLRNFARGEGDNNIPYTTYLDEISMGPMLGQLLIVPMC